MVVCFKRKERLHLIYQFGTDSWTEPFSNGLVPLNNLLHLNISQNEFPYKFGELKMFGQKFQTIHPINVFIAALNEEEGVGATISELSENVYVNRILLIDGHSNDRTVDIAKECGAEIFFQDGKGKGDALAKAVQCMGAD